MSKAKVIDRTVYVVRSGIPFEGFEHFYTTPQVFTTLTKAKTEMKTQARDLLSTMEDGGSSRLIRLEFDENDMWVDIRDDDEETYMSWQITSANIK